MTGESIYRADAGLRILPRFGRLGIRRSATRRQRPDDCPPYQPAAAGIYGVVRQRNDLHLPDNLRANLEQLGEVSQLCPDDAGPRKVHRSSRPDPRNTSVWRADSVVTQPGRVPGLSRDLRTRRHRQPNAIESGSRECCGEWFGWRNSHLRSGAASSIAGDLPGHRHARHLPSTFARSEQNARRTLDHVQRADRRERSFTGNDRADPQTTRRQSGNPGSRTGRVFLDRRPRRRSGNSLLVNRHPVSHPPGRAVAGLQAEFPSQRVKYWLTELNPRKVRKWITTEDTKLHGKTMRDRVLCFFPCNPEPFLVNFKRGYYVAALRRRVVRDYWCVFRSL